MGECSESVKGSKVGSGADRYEHACAQHGPTSLSGVKGCMNTHTHTVHCTHTHTEIK